MKGIQLRLEILYDKQLIATKQLYYLRYAQGEHRTALINIITGLNEMIYDLECKLKQDNE